MAWFPRLKQTWIRFTVASCVQLLDQPDKISWHWTAGGSYTAASAYKIQFMGSTSSNLKEIIWKTPAKQKLSAWMCSQDRFLMADKLANRGWQHNPIFSLWKCQPETAVHIFAQCSFSAEEVVGARFCCLGLKRV